MTTSEAIKRINPIMSNGTCQSVFNKSCFFLVRYSICLLYNRLNSELLFIASICFISSSEDVGGYQNLVHFMLSAAYFMASWCIFLVVKIIIMNYIKYQIVKAKAERVHQKETRGSMRHLITIPVDVAAITPTHSDKLIFSTRNSLSMSSLNFGLGLSSFINTVINSMKFLIGDLFYSPRAFKNLLSTAAISHQCPQYNNTANHASVIRIAPKKYNATIEKRDAINIAVHKDLYTSLELYVGIITSFLLTLLWPLQILDLLNYKTMIRSRKNSVAALILKQQACRSYKRLSFHFLERQYNDLNLMIYP